MKKASRRSSKTATPTAEKLTVNIHKPNTVMLGFHICGITPYVQDRFGPLAMAGMVDSLTGPRTRSSGKKKLDVEATFKDKLHASSDGWFGIPAAAFRKAIIDVAALLRHKIDRIKAGIFVHADGMDEFTKQALVRITKGDPIIHCDHVPNQKRASTLSVRPMWEPGWEAVVRLSVDADLIAPDDVATFMMRVGCQVGLGAGRPLSKSSTGCEWGLFTIVNE